MSICEPCMAIRRQRSLRFQHIMEHCRVVREISVRGGHFNHWLHELGGMCMVGAGVRVGREGNEGGNVCGIRFVGEAGVTEPGKLGGFILLSSGGGNADRTRSLARDAPPRSTPALAPSCRKVLSLHEEGKRGQDLGGTNGTPACRVVLSNGTVVVYCRSSLINPIFVVVLKYRLAETRQSRLRPPFNLYENC